MRPLAARSAILLLSTIAVLVTAAVVFVAADRFAQGEAAGHARYHLTFGLLAALLAIATQWLWRPDPSSPTRRARLAVVAALALFAATQLLESVGAFGYGPDGFSVRSESLRTLHNAAAAASGLAFPLVLVTFVVALVAVLGRLLSTRRS